MTVQQSIISDLLQRFPNSHSKTLARIALTQNREVFSNLEAARNAVRRMRGASGAQNRRKAAHKSFFRPRRRSGDPFSHIPKGKLSFDRPWAAEQIDGPLKCLVISDPHVPYHSTKAIKPALRYGKRRKPTHVLLNGDTMDCFALSKWEKDPRKRDFPEELRVTRQFLEAIREIFPKAEIIFKIGNHEERWERYMSCKAPELLGVEDFELHNLLRMPSLGIKCVRDKRPIRLGKLNVIHGHEYRFNISNPVNPARGYYLRAKAHVLGAHLHQASQHSETNIEGKVVSTWSTGCLCDLHPDYAPLNSWGHGFAFVTTDREGSFHVDNLRIIDGKVY